MREAMTVVGAEAINRNEAVRGTGIYFLIGAALGYCLKNGIPQSNTDDVRAVVRCTLRQWLKTPTNADHYAEALGKL